MTRQTFEASEFWREILKQTFSLKEQKVEICNSEIILWKHPLYPHWISTPYRDRLAISQHDAKISFSQDQYKKLKLACGNFILKDIYSLFTVNYEPPSFGGQLRRQYTNSDVKLDENVLMQLHRSARKNWRKAREEYGLVAEVNSSFSFEEFYRMYLQTRARLGVLPYPARLFRAIFDGVGRNAVVFQCRDESRSYGYLVCYLHCGEIISAHICYDFDERHKKISDFLFISAFLWAKENGLTNYRFGGDYNNQKSLIAAKVKLGALPRSQVDLISFKSKLSSDRPDGWHRRLLRSLPRSIFGHTHLLTSIYFE